MLIPTSITSLFLALLLHTPAAAAEEAKPASLSLQFSGLKWQQSSSKEDGVDGTTKATQHLTADLVDGTLWITLDGRLNLYLYPFQDANAFMSVGYMLRDDLEIGFDLGLNATKVTSPDTEAKSDLFGIFGTWSVPLASYSLENVAVYDLISLTFKEPDPVTGDTISTKTTGNYGKISSTLVVPLAKNTQYLGGVWYATDESKTSGLKTRKMQFGLLLAGIRITVD